MRISKGSQYGLEAMLELALNNGNSPLSARAISQHYDIPLQYLEQIFNRLKKARLVRTLRGPKGGYILARNPSKISVREIIEALEENNFFAAKAGSQDRPLSKKTGACAARVFWQDLNNNIIKILSETTLKDICAKVPKQPHADDVGHRYIFQI